MIRRPPRSTHCISSAASDVYKRQMRRIANVKGDRFRAIHTGVMIHIPGPGKDPTVSTITSAERDRYRSYNE